MLSVIIETRNDEDALARTLGSLVAGAIEGVVREVIVCDLGSADRTHRVAELMGCEFVAAGGVAAGIRQARSDWLLLLEPGSRLSPGWIEAVLHHANSAETPARFTRSRLDRPSFLSRLFSARRPLVDGLMIPRRQALMLAQGQADAAAIARKVSAKRLTGEIFLPQAV
jgi:glycosyltransferase involved in cell wall biosynthesis